MLERDVLEPIKKIVLEDIPYIEKLMNERKDASRDYTSYKRRLPAAKDALQNAQEQQVKDLAPYEEKVAKLEKKLASATELYEGRNSMTKKFMANLLNDRCRLMEKQYVTIVTCQMEFYRQYHAALAACMKPAKAQVDSALREIKGQMAVALDDIEEMPLGLVSRLTEKTLFVKGTDGFCRMYTHPDSPQTYTQAQ